jgi:hypothetical protein
MDIFVQVLQSPVVTGIVVPFLSFLLGYFLFRAQRKEELRLEVFRRRLDAYEKIMLHLQYVDKESHGPSPNGPSLSWKTIELTGNIRPYLTWEVDNLLEIMAGVLYDLPDSLGETERLDVELSDILHKEVGAHLGNWVTHRPRPQER